MASMRTNGSAGGNGAFAMLSASDPSGITLATTAARYESITLPRLSDLDLELNINMQLMLTATVSGTNGNLLATTTNAHQILDAMDRMVAIEPTPDTDSNKHGVNGNNGSFMADRDRITLHDHNESFVQDNGGAINQDM